MTAGPAAQDTATCLCEEMLEEVQFSTVELSEARDKQELLSVRKVLRVSSSANDKLVLPELPEQ